LADKQVSPLHQADLRPLLRHDRNILFVLAAACFALALMSVSVGSGGPLHQLWQSPESMQGLVLELRLPRVLGCMLAGALLGLGGLIAQALFRNPLADPYLLGTASGASLAVTMVYAAGLGALPLPWLMQLGSVFAAFCGAWLALVLSLLLVSNRRPGDVEKHVSLLLAGVVVALVLGALSDLLTHLRPELLRYRLAFVLGQTSLLGWDAVWPMLLALALLLMLTRARADVLDALILGPHTAASLGFDMEKEQRRLVVMMAACTAIVVAHTGLIAFVGLLAPHVVRPFVRGMHRSLMLASALAGALLLSLADLLARTLWMPNEIPTGLLTAVIGGIFLLGLLRQQLRG
jgi:iron complex transport system permease protein